MVTVIQDGVEAFCLPSCACCRACHKLIKDVDKCPNAKPYEDEYKCDPDCCDYDEIWDEDELKEELALDDDNIVEELQ